MAEMAPQPQVEKLTITDLNELYDEGKYNEILELGNRIGQDLHTRLGWCHYRNRDYAQALAQAELAGESQGAISLEASIYAYAEGYKDEAKLLELVPKLDPNNINAFNALTISARTPNSSIPQNRCGKVPNT